MDHPRLAAPSPVMAFWQRLEQKPHFKGRTYRVAQSGELNTVLLTDGHHPAVIKVPRACGPEAQNRTLLETSVVEALASCDTPAPIALPTVIDYDISEVPYYSAFSLVPGEIVARDMLLQSTTAEHEQLGRKIGAFVAWLEKAISLDTYNELYAAAPAHLPGREVFLSDSPHTARWEILRHTHPALTFLLTHLKKRYADMINEQALHPTAVGHDDLHAGNMTFTQTAIGRELHGVFDFGLTKPSSVERELRYTITLGPDTVEAAIAAYETATNKRVIRPLLGFWAVAQVATNYAYLLSINNAEAYQKQRDLARVYEWVKEYGEL